MKEEEILERIRTLHHDADIDAVGEDCKFELIISESFAGQHCLHRQWRDSWVC